jgi:hypothetical protein
LLALKKPLAAAYIQQQRVIAFEMHRRRKTLCPDGQGFQLAAISCGIVVVGD